MRLALFQPAIPQNVGACIRLGACFGVPLHVIEPTGFAFDDRAMKRAALDYGPLGHMTRHTGWSEFQRDRDADGAAGRLVLFTTRGATSLADFRFQADDTLLFGSEDAGAPDFVHAAAQARVVVPIRPETRSLNLSVTAGVALWEALRQTGGVIGQQSDL
ncbi:tRNA (cytidine(34)-2'-O)-methyltransferase [Brevundimonas sp.]|uniref:tRNA (cytidine(34)-2'-O)-methyltransferase n=1 Tax=Brevundimonas sp. TaxID=1871086 RepID=UPI002AB8B6A6|nr:tRNA (cytidine(34)-2'-O)-methyltransferase [Brevundimonas sp.]MDZ4363803.1 tRNA (cytidine(34)-2'-O)-methyltransferase [Brevundimonas sp.]